MAKSSAHIAPGKSGYLAHNSRETFSESQVFSDEENEVTHTKKEAFKIYRKELKKREKKYTERTGQKLQKKTVTHLSMVVNLEKHHTLEKLKPLVEYFEEELDTKVFQIAIHRDEGKLVHKESGKILTSGEHFFANPQNQKLYFDKNYKDEIDMSEWTMEKNYHAHIEMLGIDSEGKSIRGTFNSTLFREFQDKAAEVLGMERGQKSEARYTKEQLKEIKEKVGEKKNYKNDKEYGIAFNNIAQELGYWKPKPKRTKRKETHTFKADKAKANEYEAKIKDIQAENKRLREQLKAKGASREQYQELETVIKQLKEQVKAKDLTNLKLQKEIEHLEQKIILTTANYDTLKEARKIDEKDYIETLVTDLAIAEDTISKKDAQIANLEEKNYELEKKIKEMGNLSEEQLMNTPLVVRLMHEIEELKSKSTMTVGERIKELEKQIQDMPHSTEKVEAIRELTELRKKDKNMPAKESPKM